MSTRAKHEGLSAASEAMSSKLEATPPPHPLLMSVFSLGHSLPRRHPRSPRFTPKQETKVGWGQVKNAETRRLHFKVLQILCSH